MGNGGMQNLADFAIGRATGEVGMGGYIGDQRTPTYYDEALLRTREMLLQHDGHSVLSALGFTDANRTVQEDNYGLFILGHSIPERDKRELIRVFRVSVSVSVGLAYPRSFPHDASPHERRFLISTSRTSRQSFR